MWDQPERTAHLIDETISLTDQRTSGTVVDVAS